MKVLIVGQGGREHALAWKLAQSPSVTKVFCAPGNAGTALDAENVAIAANDLPGLLDFAESEQIGLTVVGPEAPLVDGIVDLFTDAGLTIFGPSRLAAELEGSKIFCKQVLRKANVATADFQIFDQADAAIAYVREHAVRDIVIKADGLAAGKGVLVCRRLDESIAAIRQIMVDRAYGAAGDRIIVEECLEGEEASILAIVDGKTIVPLAASQDHKRALDGDAGPNTGGMGAYSPAKAVDEPTMDAIVEQVLIPTMHQMNRAQRTFRGVLYAGLMLTDQGPKVLEYNVRFGDPETQPVLMRLESDLAEILLAAARGQLDQIAQPTWDPRPAVCVVMAADGYPGEYQRGLPVRGLEDAAQLEQVKVFHAGTKSVDGQVQTNGGRVLGVTAIGSSIPDAKLRAYRAVKCVRWDGAWCRKDISDRAR